MTLTPALFRSIKADGTDPSKLRPSDWNRVTDLINALLNAPDATGAVLLRDTTDATDGATWLPAVAAGSVLVSSGVGAAPAWSAAPSVTSILVGNGAAATPAVAFVIEPGLGLYRSSAGQLTVGNTNVSGGIPFNLGTSGFQLGNAMQLSWSNTTSALGSGGDIALVRDGAGVLAQRVGATAQAQRIYNTFTDASNYERLRLQWSSNLLELGTEAAGTGVQRDLRFDGSQLLFRSAGVTRWVISGSGFLTAFLDNTYDIGASGSGRPRHLFLGGTVTAAALTLNAGAGTQQGGVAVQIFSSTAAAGNLNTGETDLITFAMPANTLAVDGQKVRITVGGSLAGNANAKTVKLYFGSNVLVTDNGTINGGGFRLSAEVVRTGATTQVANSTSMMLRALLNGFTTPAETLASPITIKVTGQSGTASNDVIAKYMLVEWLPQ